MDLEKIQEAQEIFNDVTIRLTDRSYRIDGNVVTCYDEKKFLFCLECKDRQTAERLMEDLNRVPHTLRGVTMDGLILSPSDPPASFQNGEGI